MLDANCVWQSEPLPATVLATLSRYSELPAENDKGPIRVASVVTVHRTVRDADWEMAGTLEEALRCPDQQLRQGERITGLQSQGAAFGLLNNSSSEDSLSEGGEYHSATEAGSAAEGWVITTTYVDPAELPAAARFVTAYKKRFKVRTVGPFAVEAYDALLFVAQGLRELGSVEPERGAMVRRLRATTHKGLAKTIEFDAVTDEFRWVRSLFLHRVQNGAPRFLGRYDKIKKT